MIKRDLTEYLLNDIDFKKALVILGARQVGKTTLIENLLQGRKNVLWLNGDHPNTRLNLNNVDYNYLMQLIEEYQIIVIDEAQRIENIGLVAKMIVDAKINKQIVLTGSSSLELGNEINESLTGRKWEHNLFPLSWNEVKGHFTFAHAQARLEEFLIFGMYPDVVLSKNKQRVLSLLAGSYLYKDILELSNIKKPDLLLKILNAVALQVGSEVSYNELSNMLGVDRKTIVTYIDLLEKVFILFRVFPYSTNLRNEITAKPKIYFYDNGIRNSIIGQFDALHARSDKGALFENFIISEKIKQLSYKQFYGQYYYWRNTQKAEVDFLEVADGKITAYEIKYSPKKKVIFPKAFVEKYKPIQKVVIHSQNFWEFL